VNDWRALSHEPVFTPPAFALIKMDLRSKSTSKIPAAG
jgi:hypothetical protein